MYLVLASTSNCHTLEIPGCTSASCQTLCWTLALCHWAGQNVACLWMTAYTSTDGAVCGRWWGQLAAHNTPPHGPARTVSSACEPSRNFKRGCSAASSVTVLQASMSSDCAIVSCCSPTKTSVSPSLDSRCSWGHTWWGHGTVQALTHNQRFFSPCSYVVVQWPQSFLTQTHQIKRTTPLKQDFMP